MAAPASFHALELINDAFTEIGVLGEGDQLSGSSGALGLARLNAMVDRWATNRLTVYHTVITDKALTSGTQNYTIGMGGSINVARPLWIPYAGLVLTATTPNVESPLHIASEQDWSNQGIKTLGNAYPSILYYDKAFTAGLGTISLWPIPTTNMTLRLYLPTALAQFADLSSTNYSFPPGYYEALMYGLALRLWTPFNQTVPVPQDLRMNAAQSLGDIKRVNIDISTAPTDIALMQGNRRGVRQSAFLSGNF